MRLIMATDSDNQRLHAVVSGRVQGVNFRAYARREAVKLELTGWVRNRSNGTVETVAEGSKDALNQFLELLHLGSPSASVSSVEANWEVATGEYRDFEVRYS
jgi:acylphosphatase